MKNDYEEETANCAVAWMIMLGIIFGACMLGLLLAILEGFSII
jgi:hypothetical protein